MVKLVLVLLLFAAVAIHAHRGGRDDNCDTDQCKCERVLRRLYCQKKKDKKGSKEDEEEPKWWGERRFRLGRGDIVSGSNDGTGERGKRHTGRRGEFHPYRRRDNYREDCEDCAEKLAITIQSSSDCAKSSEPTLQRELRDCIIEKRMERGNMLTPESSRSTKSINQTAFMESFNDYRQQLLTDQQLNAIGNEVEVSNCINKAESGSNVYIGFHDCMMDVCNPASTP